MPASIQFWTHGKRAGTMQCHILLLPFYIRTDHLVIEGELIFLPVEEIFLFLIKFSIIIDIWLRIYDVFGDHKISFFK